MYRSSFFLTLVIVMSFFSGLFAQADSVTLDIPDGTLYGTLLLPEEIELPVPLVILHVGSGPTDRDGNQARLKMNTHRMLAEGLAKAGIASLRYDKRGVAASSEALTQEAELRFGDYVSDLRGWLASYQDDERFSTITVAGHSEGALIGMLATLDNEAVDAFISIAGPARPAADILREQFAGQPVSIKEMVSPILDSLEQGKTVGEVSPMIAAMFRPSVQPYMISWFQHNPSEIIARLDLPILIVQGTTDIQVPEEDASLLAAAAGKIAQLTYFSNMNHALKTCKSMDQTDQLATYMNPELPLHDGLLRRLVVFIERTSRE